MTFMIWFDHLGDGEPMSPPPPPPPSPTPEPPEPKTAPAPTKPQDPEDPTGRQPGMPAPRVRGPVKVASRPAAQPAVIR